MAILLDEYSGILVYGISGREGRFHTLQCRDYCSTRIVAGVSPSKTSQPVNDIPVFESVRQATAGIDISLALVFASPFFVMDAVLECWDGGIEKVVCITEGVPFKDLVTLSYLRCMKYPGATLIGPDCPGVISPGKAKAGIFPQTVFCPGPIGIASRSGTLSYEAAYQLSSLGIGQSTVVGVGGEAVYCFGLLDALKQFAQDPFTEAILLVDEIGNDEEEAIAEFVKTYTGKPVFAYVAGRHAPRHTAMGHTGAVLSAGARTGDQKLAAYRSAGIQCIENISALGSTIKHYLETTIGGNNRGKNGPRTDS